MDAFTISIGSFFASLLAMFGVFQSVLKARVEQASLIASLESRVHSLEKRAQKVDETLERVVADIGEIKASLARLEGYLLKRTPVPK